MTTAAILPGHGRSTTLPRKIVAPIAGKPLVWWTIRAALESEVIDRVYVSTDDQEVADIALENKCDVLWRTEHFIKQSATIKLDDIVAYHLRTDKIEGDPVVLLQPTSPFRTAEDIKGAMEFYREKKADCVFGAIPQGHFLWVMNATNKGPVAMYRPEARKNRQQLKDWVWENGAIYITRRAIWDKLGQRVIAGDRTFAYMMDKLHSIEIDDQDDLRIANLIAGNGHV